MGGINITYTVTMGDILVAITLVFTVLGGIVTLLRNVRRVELSVIKLALEHELLIADYCTRHGITKEELVTRLKTLFNGVSH